MSRQFNENRQAACQYLGEVAKDTSFTQHHKGFTTVPQKIHRCFGLTPYQRLIMIDLFGYMGDKHFCYPSQETIARNIGCSSKTIGRHLESLVEMGMILINESQRHHTYYLPDDLHKNPYVLLSEKTHEFISEVRNTVNDYNLSLWINGIIYGEGYDEFLAKLSNLMRHRFSFDRGESEKGCLAEYKQYLADQYTKKFKKTDKKSE